MVLVLINELANAGLVLGHVRHVDLVTHVAFSHHRSLNQVLLVVGIGHTWEDVVEHGELSRYSLLLELLSVEMRADLFDVLSLVLLALAIVWIS